MTTVPEPDPIPAGRAGAASWAGQRERSNRGALRLMAVSPDAAIGAPEEPATTPTPARQQVALR